MTTQTVRARFHNGVLELLDEVDLVEDQEVLLTLEEQPGDPPRVDGLLKSAGAWADQFKDHKQLIKDIYQARLDGTRPPRRP